MGGRQEPGLNWLTGTLSGAALVLVVACSVSQVEIEQAVFLAFGSEVEVRIRTSDREAARAALGRLGEDFQRMHRDWHPWEPGDLTELNAALASGEWISPAASLAPLIERSRELETISDGHFNAGIGALIELWGFHTSDYPILAPPPSATAIDALIDSQPGLHQLEFRDGQLRSPNPLLQLDFSGMAKGMAGQLGCWRLAEFGLSDALINLGGDVVLCGPGEPWRIAVSDRGTGLLEGLELSGPAAAFTSGVDQRWGTHDGKRYAHLLDPGTGQPVDHLMQATVVAEDPVVADAAATALVVAGPDDWRAVAERFTLTAALVIDGEGRVFRTGRWPGDGPQGR